MDDKIPKSLKVLRLEVLCLSVFDLLRSLVCRFECETKQGMQCIVYANVKEKELPVPFSELCQIYIINRAVQSNFYVGLKGIFVQRFMPHTRTHGAIVIIQAAETRVPGYLRILVMEYKLNL